MKKFLALSAVVCCAAFTACNSSNKNADFAAVHEKADSIDQAKAEEQAMQDTPEALMAKALDSLSTVGEVAGQYNNVVYYFKKAKDGYKKTIFGYDVVNKTSRNINLKGLGLSPEEYITICDYSMIDNRIALIVSDGGRCGSGAALGSAFVYVCDVTKGTKRPHGPSSDGYSDANFINNKKQIRLSIGDITNYDDDVCAADYEYAFHDEVISF